MPDPLPEPFEFLSLTTLVVGGIVLGVLWVLVSFLIGGKTVGGGGVVAVFAKKPRSNAALLVGLCGSGKTAIFLRLVGDEGEGKPLPETNTSMQANKGSLGGAGTHNIIDYPGHRRLRGGLYEALQASKRLVVVVDSITIQDDQTQGAQAVADLLYDVLQCNAFDGVESVLFACTKRDDVTSFSAKAVRRLVEIEIARQLATRSGGVGSIEKVSSASGQVAKGSRRAVGAPDERSDECVLMTQPNGKYSFDDLRVPVSFVDVTSMSGDEDFNLDAVKSFIESGLSPS
jgi:signal recognition particle receptor subunit beta